MTSARSEATQANGRIPGKVYLATSAQVYPTVTSWNGSVIQAQRTLDAMAADPLPRSTAAKSEARKLAMA